MNISLGEQLEKRMLLSGLSDEVAPSPGYAMLYGIDAATSPSDSSPAVAQRMELLFGKPASAAALIAAAANPALDQRANRPIGVAKGIHPGRVAWVYDSSATPWDGRSGNWWDDNGTDQRAVDRMMSRGLRGMTGAKSDKAAWDAIFKYYNRTHGRGSRGYNSKEMIALKINLNNSRFYEDRDNQLDATPQTVLAMVRQLVRNARVPQKQITIYDAVRPIPDRIYNRIHQELPNVRFVDSDGGNGRIKNVWVPDAIRYAISSECGTSIPQVAKQATYMINMSLLKGHRTAGVTLTAKNHYGSINERDHTYIHSSARPLGTYSPFVDLIGHKDLGGKTILYMIDGLYGTNDLDVEPRRWSMAPFNGGWSSSFFFSQDPIAIDSVGADFLMAEFGSSEYFMKNADNYLHEAATANTPPSGAVYRPNGGGKLKSLGVHEHWNNPVKKQYTRNLKAGKGIELFRVK